MRHAALIALLAAILSALFAAAIAPALAEVSAAAPAPAGASPEPSVTPAEAQKALDVLQDAGKRAALIETLQAIAKTQAASSSPARSAPPALADEGFGALSDTLRSSRRYLTALGECAVHLDRVVCQSPVCRQPRAAAVIAEKAPGSLDELARITGKAKSNLSRTLRTMEGYGLVRLERGERSRITPKVMHDRVELDLPLTPSRKAS